MRLFSYKNRPVHLGRFPAEKLSRVDGPVDLEAIPAPEALVFDSDDPRSILPAMGDFMAVLDAIRDGRPHPVISDVPSDLTERSQHLKAAGYYFDSSLVGICSMAPALQLPTPRRNPALSKLAAEFATLQPKTLAAGIDVVMADVRDSAAAEPGPMETHSHVAVFLIEHPREPDTDEPGGRWIAGSSRQRSALRAAEIAAVLSNYLRIMGFEARGHTETSSELNLERAAVAAGLTARGADGQLENPFVGRRYSLAAVSTNFAMAADRPLARVAAGTQAAWSRATGWAGTNSSRAGAPYGKRKFVEGAFPFEKIKRVDQPTTYIDEPNVARVPKRTDMFARALFGDMGPALQAAAKNGGYVAKNPMGYCARRALAALILLQDGKTAARIDPSTADDQQNADSIKAALYYLGCDAVGLSRCPEWAYYSHNSLGEAITPYHKNAVSFLVDQGHETMDGSSGDDWISGCQSMRAYLRGSILGGVVANHIRRLGYSARVHSVVDGEVLQPPLLLLSGLGEVSRIGEVILNPYLGPRLKSAAITTNMPFVFDKPIDFGMQNFCENCKKCARECPSGAITAGPKLMFNGYEIWKSDSERCARYRVGQTAGALCGRCMKTCPWNLEGLFKEAPFRWAAMKMPAAAKYLAALDDAVGNGEINLVKKWWWDLVWRADGSYGPAPESNERPLQPDLDLQYADQVLAVYPANLAPHPWPYPYPMDREAGIKAYGAMISADQYQELQASGEGGWHQHVYTASSSDSPVLKVRVSTVEKMTDDVTKYEFELPDGGLLPAFEAGAHVDVVVAPEFFRQFSLSGDPADLQRYQIAVLREDEGRGGSALMHRIFSEGRTAFISRPLNHFPLDESATKTLLLGGGIGVTPMIAMAHRLHAMGAAFELHYSCHSRAAAGFLDDLSTVPWAGHVRLHFSDEGSRLDLAGLLSGYTAGCHVYTCGPDRYMSAVLETAEQQGWPDDAVHKEYFSVPEAGDWENKPFKVRVVDRDLTVDIPVDQSITDVLEENGIHIAVKCSDGICGVCACKLVSGAVEHRDYVLSAKDREEKMIICSSRATEEDGLIEIDLS